jgi:hypothetical protein
MFFDGMSGVSRSDCEVIREDFEDVFESLEACVETLVDERRNKRAVIGGFFGILGSTSKLLWHGTGCAIRHTPKAIATVAAVKRELVETVTEELRTLEKERQELEIRERIMELKKRTGE